ncbi:site-specific integrase [Brucella anthropi]|uniref:tyrosine-type recombinase/integrase n=1 Tax=Brucella anthropi TaxID=529 RepID=UPI00188AA531|nr:tyrosine-type recombinase/integrase [Brucella anthropi]QPA29253.1 site-specific integrase [Brucella anthropi]
MADKLTKKLVETAQATGKPYFLWDAGDGAVKGFGIKVSGNGKKTFVAQFRIGSGRAAPLRRVTIGSFGVWTVDKARDRAAELIREGQRGVDRSAIEEAARTDEEAARAAADKERLLARDLRIDRLAARFMREHVKAKRKSATNAFYRHIILRYVFPQFKRRDARTITRAEVTKLHVSLADRPATANRVLATLSAIYGHAEKVDLLPETMRRPTFRVEKYKEQAKERFLNVDELQRLGTAIREAETAGIPYEVDETKIKSKHAPKLENRFVKIDPEAAAALRLLIFTGARLREILNLTWHEVDLERGLLRLRDSKTGPKTVLLNAPARAVLIGLLDKKHSEYVFPGESRGGKPQPRTDLKRPWRLVCKAARLEGVRIHDLRHSFASAGANDGHGLFIVGKLLGHSQASTTQRYAHLADDPLRQASDAIANKIAEAMGDTQQSTPADVVQFRKREA